MNINGLLDILEFFDKENEWFLRYLSWVLMLAIAMGLAIHLYRFAKGKINIWGKSMNQCRVENILKNQLLDLQKDKKIIEDILSDCKRETLSLEEELLEKTKTIKESKEHIQKLESLYEEVDAKYNDETYVTSQIMFTAEEVSYAISNIDDFNENRADVYKNLLDYLVNMMGEFRETSPRIVMFIPDPNDETRLKHYTHSSGYPHHISKYTPPVYGSAAGKAWRKNQPYYIPDITQGEHEFEFKKNIEDIKNLTLFCAPIKAGTNPCANLGVLCISGKPANAFDQTEIERVLLFTSIIYPLMYVDVKIKGC